MAMKTVKRKQAPKLPRFIAPKDMKSKVFKTKKDKASARQRLKLDLKRSLEE